MNRLQLKQLRITYGYSLRQLSKKVGFAFTYLDQLEKGIRPISPETKKKILQAMYQLDMEKSQTRGEMKNE